MVETLSGEVVYAVPPSELDDCDLREEVRALAESRHVLVCRAGGAPSLFERALAFVLGRRIEAVTLLTEAPVAEGEQITATVRETSVAGVYEATSVE